MLQCEKLASSKYHHVYGAGCFESLHKNFKVWKRQIFWNVAITYKYYLTIALYFIRSVYVAATCRTVTEETKEDIVCAVNAVRHNKPISVHKQFLPTHITPNLCPALLQTNLLPVKYCASAEPSQHQVKIHQFSPFLTYWIVDCQNLTFRDTEDIWLRTA